jgi:hypothetical protein
MEAAALQHGGDGVDPGGARVRTRVALGNDTGVLCPVRWA